MPNFGIRAAIFPVIYIGQIHLLAEKVLVYSLSPPSSHSLSPVLVMKYFGSIALLVGCLFVIAAETPAPATSADAKREDIRKLLQLTGAAANGRMMVEAIIGEFRKTMPEVPEDFWADFMNEVKEEELLTLSMISYEKHMSHKDIRELIKFYESPAGSRFVAAQPLILRDAMAAGEAWGQQLARRVEERWREKAEKDGKTAR